MLSNQSPCPDHISNQLYCCHVSSHHTQVSFLFRLYCYLYLFLLHFLLGHLDLLRWKLFFWKLPSVIFIFSEPRNRLSPGESALK